MKNKNQQGFTIVELLIATLVFSIVLIMACNAIIMLGKYYYKGIAQSKTQEKTRIVSEDIIRSLQFGNGFRDDSNIMVPLEKKYCIDGTFYTAYINKKVNSSTPGLTAQKFDDSGCSVASGSPNEILSENMRLLRFDITSSDQLYNLSIRIAYGDNDLLSNYDDNATDASSPKPSPAIEDALCKSNNPGSSFCATARLDTTVKERIL